MKRIVVLVAIGAMLAGFATTSPACGGDIEGAESPEASVENNTLEMPSLCPGDRSRTFSDNLVVDNVGPGDMEVTSVEWIERPNRVHAYHGDGLECDGDGECGGGECVGGICECWSSAECPDDSVCLTQAGQQVGQCYDTGFSGLRESIRNEDNFSHNLIIADHEQDFVSCPDFDSADAPSEAPEGEYCGAIAVETNATNTGTHVENGDAVFFLVSDEKDAGDAILEIPDTFASFTLATPGVTQTKDIELANPGTDDLELQEVFFTGDDGIDLSVSPAPHEVTIPGGGTETITLSATPDESEFDEDDEFNVVVTVEIETSSACSEPRLSARVTDGIGDAPMIEVEPMQLSFADGLSQTLEIHNHGEASLPLNSMQIQPEGSFDDSEAYDVLYGGTSVIGNPGALPAVTSGSTEEFTVEFDPDSVEESPIAKLRINHQDSMADNQTHVDLLGDSSTVALGEIAPTPVYFRSDGDGQTQERTLALSNLGNDDLTIEAIEFDELSPTTDSDYFEVEGFEAGTTVQAGQIEAGTLRYDGQTQMDQDLNVRFQSDDHVGSSNAMTVTVTAVPQSEPTMDIEILPSFPQAAEVGEPAAFQVVDHEDQANLTSATWTLHERPADSQATIEGTGSEVGMTPDEAGEYRLSVTIEDGGNRQVQQMLTFPAEL